jgi:hypothetical protein
MGTACLSDDLLGILLHAVHEELMHVYIHEAKCDGEDRFSFF